MTPEFILERIPVFITAASKLLVLDCPEVPAVNGFKWSAAELTEVDEVPKLDTGGRCGLWI